MEFCMTFNEFIIFCKRPIGLTIMTIKPLAQRT